MQPDSSTLDFNRPKTPGFFPPQLPSGLWGTTSVYSYHNTDGKPLFAYAPQEPVRELCWNARFQIQKELGKGSQGVVYLATREGVDGYFTNVALKVFYRHPRFSLDEYVTEMQRIALQAQLISRIQHDNLISIRDFVALEETRVMVIEWIDGLDLGRLLDLDNLEVLKKKLSHEDWARLCDVVVTPGEHHCRLKPGIAVDILRGCLAGLSALHHNGIAHCDLKPSNIMIKRAGTKKIIDIDSSTLLTENKSLLRGTPYYMAPEQLQRKPIQLRSDIASLGYILIEMLTGQQLFRECKNQDELLQAKLQLPARLEKILPPEVLKNAILYGLVSRMVAVDPGDRYPNAEAADLDKVGAASFHRQLVRSNLSTEYDRELAWWLEKLV